MFTNKWVFSPIKLNSPIIINPIMEPAIMDNRLPKCLNLILFTFMSITNASSNALFSHLDYYIVF